MALYENFSFFSLIVSDAQAADSAPAAGAASGIMSFLPLIVIFVIFYFLLIRPQSKRAKEHREMVSKLAKGDEVVTSGGLLAKVSEVGEIYLTLEVANGVLVKLQRAAVTQVLPKGTIKDA